jgi:hypothetical protein
MVIRRRPFLTRFLHNLEDLIDEVNWRHVAYKAVAYSYLLLILWLISFILPFRSNWSISPEHSGELSMVYQDLTKYVC